MITAMGELIQGAKLRVNFAAAPRERPPLVTIA